MIVVSGTSPIFYLLLIDQLGLLPQMYDRVFIPQVVQVGMLSTKAPLKLRQWIAVPPNWLTRLPPIRLAPESAVLLAGLRQHQLQVVRQFVRASFLP